MSADKHGTAALSTRARPRMRLVPQRNGVSMLFVSRRVRPFRRSNGIVSYYRELAQAVFQKRLKR